MGMLSALAAAFSTCLTDLVEMTPQIIRIALRLGFAIVQRAVSIENTMKSWSIVILGSTEEQISSIIHDFNDYQVRVLYPARIPQAKHLEPSSSKKSLSQCYLPFVCYHQRTPFNARITFFQLSLPSSSP